MVAIVILLALSIGGFILGQYDSAEADVYATVEFEEMEDDSVGVIWTKKGTADQIVVTNGTDTKTIDSLGDSQTMWFGSEGEDIQVLAKAGPNRQTFLTKHESPEFKSTVYAESSTCDDVDVNGDGANENYCGSKVVLNGTDISSQHGANILVFDSQGRFHSYANYDTHNNNEYRPPTYSLASDGTPDMNAEKSCSGCVNDRALSHLQTVPENHYILIVGDGQPGQVQSSLEDEYKRMGAEFSNDNTLEYHDSWIIASQKTDNDGTDEYDKLFEEHAPRGDQSGVPFVKAHFYAPHDD